MQASDLEFVREVDRLGHLGLTQEEIAERLSLGSKWVVRNRLKDLGFRWESESRVRDARSGRPLDVMLDAGELLCDESADEVAA